MKDPITADDRALIESTRKVNKVLSMFVMALQEQCRPPTESQFSVAAMLTTLADDIRERAATHAKDNMRRDTSSGLPDHSRVGVMERPRRTTGERE